MDDQKREEVYGFKVTRRENGKNVNKLQVVDIQPLTELQKYSYRTILFTVKICKNQEENLDNTCPYQIIDLLLSQKTG